MNPGSFIGNYWISGRDVVATATLENVMSCRALAASASVSIGPFKDAINHPADINKLELARTELSVQCPLDERKIAVSVAAIDPENDVLVFDYVVSAGKILGSGANVVWDLAGVPPGKYTITVGGDDGCGICGRTMTRDVLLTAPKEICH